MKKYYEILNRLSWYTIPRFRRYNEFGRFYEPSLQKTDPQANELIIEKINSKQPLLIGRHGAVELRIITNILAYKNQGNLISDSIKYLLNKKARFWEINESIRNTLCYNAGFFPNDESLMEKFADLYIQESKKIDIYGASTFYEHLLPKSTIPANSYKTYIKNLEPWFYENPWTYQLKGKKVLVVYPLKDLVLSQYKNKRNELFQNKKTLPDFNLEVMESVQTIASNKTSFKNWFEALEYQKEKMSKIDFDFAIIGAGAYGFPLAAHAKDMGKQAIHFGGATQILFGIKGNRWNQWDRYKDLMNGSWLSPPEKDIPDGAENIENKAYW